MVVFAVGRGEERGAAPAYRLCVASDATPPALPRLSLPSGGPRSGATRGRGAMPFSEVAVNV
jgi:hypothetical protein